MISIIIPAYNEEKYLPRLLGCIMGQTYKDYEVIVADADSKDRTRQVAKKYGCKVVKGGFPARGRNCGARAAKGEFLLFLDADVQIGRDFLENALRQIHRKNLDVAGCYIRPLSSSLTDKIFFAIFNFWTFCTQAFYPNASGGGIFCRNSLHKKANGFDETIMLSEDMEYVKRCGRLGKFRVLKDATAHVSMRRFKKEGRIRVGLKLLLSALYRLIFGEIRSDIFRYNLRYRK